MLIIDGKEYKINEEVAYVGKHICNNVKVLIWELGKLKRYNFLFFAWQLNERSTIMMMEAIWIVNI